MTGAIFVEMCIGSFLCAYILCVWVGASLYKVYIVIGAGAIIVFIHAQKVPDKITFLYREHNYSVFNMHLRE